MSKYYLLFDFIKNCISGIVFVLFSNFPITLLSILIFLSVVMIVFLLAIKPFDDKIILAQLGLIETIFILEETILLTLGIFDYFLIANGKSQLSFQGRQTLGIFNKNKNIGQTFIWIMNVNAFILGIFAIFTFIKQALDYIAEHQKIKKENQKLTEDI